MNTRKQQFMITASSIYHFQTEMSLPIRHAWQMIARDHETVFGKPPLQGDDADVIVRYAEPEDGCPEWPEAFCFRYADGAAGQKVVLHLVGRDELGIIYGLLHFSHTVLGVDPFWYWAELLPARREMISLPACDYNSAQPKVRYRGWFVNDEVCLIGWKEEYPPTEEVWLPVFEALLRCGGNMVIPGTDLPKTGIHHKLATEMGLWVTHHHAEPLGAEMFLRAYPGKQASYSEHPELFEGLWRAAIEKQQHDRIVWVLSFRGQGDKPFWEDDPAFDTLEKRGALISSVVQRQYGIVKEYVDDPVCCMAMYGEIAELYKAGHIEVPADIIKVWADNGYGKMVSRRHGNLNLRVRALPDQGDGGKHGVYYHVTFHDLQASNHLTMFPGRPEFIAEELEEAFHCGASEYLLVNSGNILPHLYTLDLTAWLWQDGTIDVEEHRNKFIGRLYSSQQGQIAGLYQQYADCAIAYGPNEDDLAGDEFYHHPARKIMGHWLRGKADTDDSLVWATGRLPFAEQVRWFKEKAAAAEAGWYQLRENIRQVMKELSEEDARRLHVQLLVQIELHLSGCRGLIAICTAYEGFRAELYPQAFVYASQAVWRYKSGLHALREAEQGQWEHFYRADWLTNIANTIEHADTVRKYLRVLGDSPDMFLWYKEYLMPETEKYIYLENTHRNPLPNDELACRLEKKFAIGSSRY
ncbi:glycosyl hydrolase 115 family protein [Paenibacillus lentus]|uniref:glycosyl hydrolase 115 family protein n=1 Tax=Paenibacillus lentus TaxID=1338368 RepID=UPI003657F0EE